METLPRVRADSTLATDAMPSAAYKIGARARGAVNSSAVTRAAFRPGVEHVCDYHWITMHG